MTEEQKKEIEGILKNCKFDRALDVGQVEAVPQQNHTITLSRSGKQIPLPLNPETLKIVINDCIAIAGSEEALRSDPEIVAMINDLEKDTKLGINYDTRDGQDVPAEEISGQGQSISVGE